MDTTEGREWQLRREQDGIISSPGWPGCRSSCASETQGTLTDRGVSQWAQTPKRTQHIEQHKPLKFQMGKAVAIPRCKDRWARNIFNNTRTSLCVYHWRDAEWAQLGSLSTADGEAKIPTHVLMFWDLWPAWGQSSFRPGHWPLCTPPNTTGQKKHTMVINFKALK